MRWGRKQLFDVPAEYLDYSDTESLECNAPLWTSWTLNATSNQLEEAAGLLVRADGAGCAGSSSSVGGAEGWAWGGSGASGQGKPPIALALFQSI